MVDKLAEFAVFRMVHEGFEYICFEKSAAVRFLQHHPTAKLMEGKLHARKLGEGWKKVEDNEVHHDIGGG